MKKLFGIFGSLVFICMLTMLAGTSSAHGGQWIWVHGHSGHFWADLMTGSGQSNPSKSGLHVYGLSLPTAPAYADVKPGYVYCAIPTISGGSWTARFIKILVGGFDNPVPPMAVEQALVTQITVNNGNDTVKTFTGQWGGAGYHEIALDLGASTTFSKGVGIELKLVGPPPTGIGGINASITIIAVGAEFVQGGNITAVNSFLLKD
jgi:hypothetical protein